MYRMKKASILLVIITSLFVTFTVGFMLGRDTTHSEVIVSALPSSAPTDPLRTDSSITAPGGPIDLNSATVHELSELPGIGEVLAQRIVDYREKNGPFSSPGELANVSGIGEKRLEAIWDLVTVEGE
jgi:competence protein ComEA